MRGDVQASDGMMIDARLIAISYLLTGTEENPVTIDRTKQADGSIKWAVRRGAFCMNRDGDFEYEPLPSNRDSSFLARCRFESIESALAAIDGIAPKSQ